VGHSGSSDVLTMSVSVVIPAKLHGNKVCMKKKNDSFFGLFGIALRWP